MATKTGIALKGASGAAYDFEVYRWGTGFNPIGAVYAVMKLRTDGRYDIIYIGQTGDLSERFDDHHKAWCFEKYGRTHIGVHPEASEPRRLAIERDLIDNYLPSCNGN